MGIRQRKTEADYINIKTGEGPDNWVFMGTGFTTIDEKPGGETTEKRYVCDATASQSLSSYKWQADFEADQIEDDDAIEYIVAIGKELKTGGNCETDYIKVDLDKQGEAENTYYARKFHVAVQVSEFPNNDGELGVSGSFLALGDPVIGTFNVTDKSFTKKTTS